MALFDFLTKFQDKFKHSTALSDFKEQHPEFREVPDDKLAGALSTKYPDQYGYLKDYDPSAAVPAEQVPEEMRTKEFYQKNPTLKPQAVATDTLKRVKASYPEFKDVPDEKLAAALETKYPGKFPKLAEAYINEKHGALTVDTTPERDKTIIDKVSEFMGVAPTPADRMTDADAAVTLSRVTGYSPAQVQEMGLEGQRALVREYGGIHADPTNMEYNRKLLGMSAIMFGGLNPKDLLVGLMKFQAVHTAISQSIKAYKGEAQLAPEQGIKTAWGLLDERDISDLASPNATAQQKELLQMLQFGAEIGLVGQMNKKSFKRLQETMKGAKEVVVKGAKATGKAAAKGAEKVTEGVAEVGRGLAEGAKVRAENKGILKDLIKQAERRGVTKANQKALIRDAKALLREKVTTGGEQVYDTALVGEINKMRSTFVVEAKAPAKTTGADLRGAKVSPEHKVIQEYKIAPKEYAKVKLKHPGKTPIEIAEIMGKVPKVTPKGKKAEEVKPEKEPEKVVGAKEGTPEEIVKQYEETHASPSIEGIKLWADSNVADTEERTSVVAKYKEMHPEEVPDKPEEISDIHPENIESATSEQLKGLLDTPGGHPDEQGLNVTRSEMLEEIDKRGEKILEDIKYPTKPDTLYRNIHTGHEETYETLKAQHTYKTGTQLFAIAEHWKPAVGKNETRINYLQNKIRGDMNRYESEEEYTTKDGDIKVRKIKSTSEGKRILQSVKEAKAELKELGVDFKLQKGKPVKQPVTKKKAVTKKKEVEKEVKLRPVTVERFNQEKAPLAVEEIKVEPALVEKANKLQDALGKELYISSGYRTPEYNEELKRRGYSPDERSLHLQGRAFDVNLKKTGVTHEEVIEAAKKAGLDVEDITLTKYHAHLELPTKETPTKLQKDLSDKKERDILKDEKGEKDVKSEGRISDGSRTTSIREELSEREVVGDEPENRRTFGGSPDIERSGTRDTSDTTGSEEDTVTNLRLTPDKPVELTKTQRQALNKQAKAILEKPVDEITEEEREILRQYTGSGGLQEAEEGVLTQHYTPYAVINFIWDKLKALGVKTEGASALEAAGGVGNFVGLKPDGVNFDVVEMDETASKIASVLYPEENHYNLPFEKFTTNNFYDISIGNDPFGNFRGDIRFAEEAAEYADIKQIHDFFITKRLDLLKPNGVLAVIVSTGTMDKINADARIAINKKAVFLGGYRLPIGAFKKNTQYEGSVDLLFFRKRVVEEIKKGTKHLQPEFIKSDYVNVPTTGGQTRSVLVSKYFQDNPKQVWGKLVTTGQYGTQVGAKTTKPISDFIERSLKDDIKYEPAKSKFTKQQGGYKDYEGTGETTDSPDVAFGSFVGITKEGEILMAGHPAEDGGRSIVKSGVKVAAKGTTKAKLDVAIDLMEKTERFTREIRDNGTINKKLQADIKKQVTAYTKKYNKAIGYDVTVGKLKDDPRFFKLAGLITPDGELADVLTKDKLEIGVREIAPFKTGNLKDAVRYVKETTNTYSTAEIAKLMGEDVEAVEKKLVEDEGWNIIEDRIEPDVVYLYGDLLPKMDKAAELGLDKQVEKLLEVIPEQAMLETVEADPIYLWIPTEIRDAWLEHVGVGGTMKREVNPTNGVLEWVIEGGKDYGGDKELYINENTAKGSIEKYLNHVKETEDVDMGGAKPVRVYSPEKTAKLQKVREMFEDWFKNKADANLTDKAVEQYNYHYNSYRRREPDATPQDIGGISKTFKGKDLKVKSHQWEWVAQATDMGKTINAHGVGGGKTMAAILMAQLADQNRTAKRKMLLVPAKVIRKWASEIQELFPSAKILSLENLSQSNAYKMLQQVAMNDFDFVLISTDRLKTIPIKGADKYLQEDIDAFEQRIRLLNEGKSSRNKKKTEKRLQEDLLKMKEKLASLQQMKKTNTIFFEDLNVDMLIVDEAHNYKNVYVDWGSWSSEQGIATQNNSERASDLWYKTRVMRDKGEGYIHFLTATPTPNNPIEIYAMLRYLAPEEWTSRGIMSAGDFVDQFCVVDNVGVPDVTGIMTTKQMISGYKNLKALREIFKKYVDFRRFEDMADIDRPDAKYSVVEVPISKEQMKIGAKIVAEMNFAKTSPKEAQEQGISLLSLTTQSRQNAVGADVWNGFKYEEWESQNSKLAYLVERVKTMHKRSGGSGQLVFLDLFKGREPVSFEDKKQAQESGIPLKLSDRTVYVNYHKKVRDKLVEAGIPKNKIAIVNGETNQTPKQKQKIMDEYNNGDLTVVIGTTKSMGEGMDLQADTVAIHNVDVPWTPDELTQRNGRGVRQGNKNDLVTIFNYVTKGSLDAFMYGKLHRKDKWNKELWLGDQDEVGNINLDQEQGLSYEELSEALTIDEAELKFWENVRQSEALRNKLAKLQADQNKVTDRVARIENDIAERQTKIRDYEREIVEAEPGKDTAYLTSRIEGHREKLAEAEKLLEEVRAEETGVRAEVDTARSEMARIDAEIEARGGLDEDDTPEAPETVSDEEADALSSTQSVDDIIDEQTRELRGFPKGAITIPDGVDLSGMKEGLLSPWNKAMDWLWKYNEQRRFDPGLADKFRKTTEELSQRVSEAIIEVNNLIRGKSFTIKERVKATFAAEEKSFYAEADEKIQKFSDIFTDLFTYIDTKNKEKGIYKQSFIDRVLEEALDKQDQLQSKIAKYTDENSTYNASYGRRQAEKYRKKIKDVERDIEQIRDLRFVSHKNVVQAVLDKKLSILNTRQRRVWLSNARRLSFKYKHRKGIVPLREYLKSGLLKPEDLDIVKIAMKMLSEAQFRWTMKDLFDYAKESGYIISARSLKKHPQAKEWSILNPLKHGIVAPEYQHYRIHPIFEDGLVELKATLVRKGGFIRMFYGIVKMGQFIKPMIIWKYDFLQAALGGALGVKTPYYLAKAIQLWTKARVQNQPEGDFRLGQKLNIFQRADIPVVGSKSEEEAIAMAARRTLADYPAVSKILEGLLDMPLTTKNVLNIIKVAYKAIGNVTWGGDEIIRLSTFIAYKDMGYSDEKAAYLTSQWHGAYGDISTKARGHLGLVFFVYAFRFLMPRQIFRLILEPMKMALAGMGYAGGKIVGKGAKALPELPEKADVLRVIKGIAALIFLILGVDYLFRKKGFTRKRGAQFWKWVKTSKDRKGKTKDMIVSLNLIYNQIPKQIYRLMSYDPTNRLPRALQGLQKLAKWELHPIYRIVFWDIASNRKSIGAGQVYNPNATGLKKGLQITKYFITESVRLLKLLEEEPDVTEAYVLEEKDKQALWDATLKKHEQVLVDAFGYKYITRNQKENFDYAMWRVKREFNKRKRYAKTREQGNELEEWVRFSENYFRKLYGQPKNKKRGK